MVPPFLHQMIHLPRLLGYSYVVRALELSVIPCPCDGDRYVVSNADILGFHDMDSGKKVDVLPIFHEDDSVLQVLNLSPEASSQAKITPLSTFPPRCQGTLPTPFG